MSKFRELRLPENYYVRSDIFGENEINIFDKDISTGSLSFPHGQVARLSIEANALIIVLYWEDCKGIGDRVDFSSLEDALCHVEAMAGMGMLGRGYTKGMLNE